jgi:hypothetical protein
MAELIRKLSHLQLPLRDAGEVMTTKMDRGE